MSEDVEQPKNEGEDFVAPETGKEEIKQSEIEKIKQDLVDYYMAKVAVVEHSEDRDSQKDESLVTGMESLDDLEGERQKIEEELAHTGKLQFRKRAELKMQRDALKEMSWDQGGSMIKPKTELLGRSIARDRIKKFEEQYGSEARAQEKINALESELTRFE